MTKREEMAMVNEDALVMDEYEDALIGYIERFQDPPIALYDRDKLFSIMMERDGMTLDEAYEWYNYNILGSILEGAPAFAVFFGGKA